MKVSRSHISVLGTCNGFLRGHLASLDLNPQMCMCLLVHYY